MSQQKFDFHQPQVVNVYPEKPECEPEIPERMDETMRVRFTPSKADAIRTFCQGRKITTSEYFRKLAELDPVFYDEIEVLNQHRDLLFPLLKRLAKKF